MDNNGQLLAHWKLDGSAEDASGSGAHGAATDVTYESVPGVSGKAAVFNGRTSQIRVDRSPLQGTEEFSVSLWAHTEAHIDDVLGDLMSWYDPKSRTGFNLGIQTAYGVTTHQANYRHLYFGVDAGSKPVWRDCGRPGNAIYIMALATFEGSLYAGTFETQADESGHVYRYIGGQEWEDCGSPDPCNSVSALAVFDGALYAGVTRYNAQGSSLPESANVHPGGRVYRYAGGKEWIDCGQLPGADSVMSLTVYKGDLYSIPLYSQGLFRYAGGTTWEDCGTPGRRLMALGVFDGDLYAAGNEGGGVFRYLGNSKWEECGYQEGMTQIYSFAVYRGELHIGAWPEARVYAYDGDQGWLDRGRMGDELETMGMMVYNGKLYAGTLPLAEMYRYDGDKTWTRLQQLDLTPDVRYRRAWSMAVHGGRLYCGTLPSGRVYSIEAGSCVTHDRELQPGWRHIAAVRSASALSLYVDGAEVARLDAPGAGANITNETPLTIGFGPVDSFLGAMRDVRLYRGALTGEQIRDLAARNGS